MTQQERPSGNGSGATDLWRRSLRRRALATAASVVLTIGAGAAQAGPEGGRVVRGEGNISRSNTTTTRIQQRSNSLAINWDSFDVARNESVVFQQPSSSSVVLNRIFDQKPSQIFGAIDANGRVFLLNPNGMVFGESASVNVAALLASSLDMNVDDFMNGRYELSALADKTGGLIVNRGLIKAATGGSVSLVGGQVANEGVIVADYGEVNLAAGRKATLDFDGDGLLMFAVDEAPLDDAAGADATVTNSGLIQADGGRVLLTASRARDVFTDVVNNEGIIEASRIDNQGGVIRLVSSAGRTVNSGTLDVSGADAASTGGTVHVLGGDVELEAGARIDASGAAGGGTVLVGGDFRGGGDVQRAEFANVEHDVTITADAKDSGDGGRVVVWADGTTTFQGEISARGGELSGDGGLVEVSGKEYLVYRGRTDTRAPNGNFGSLWLDPGSITVCDGADGGCLPDNDELMPNIFSDDFLAGALDLASVTLDTSIATDAGNEDITFSDPNIDITWTAATTFTLEAGRNVTLDGTIAGTNAGSAFDVNFGNLATGGTLDVLASADLSGMAGPITMTGDNGGDTLNIFAPVTATISGGQGADFINIDAAVTGNVIGAGGIDTFNVNDTVTGDLDAGAADDVVVFGASGAVSGTLIGGGGTNDSADYSLVTANVDVVLAGNVTGVESLTGDNANDTLTGPNVANNWTIDGENDGTVGGVSFTDFSNLTGGALVDDFAFTGTGNLTGELDGGTGADTADYSAVTSAIDAALIRITSVNILNAGTAGTANPLVTLVGDNGPNVWAIDDVDDGTVDGVTFTDFANLRGGTNTDMFVFTLDGNVTGTIDGGGGGGANDADYSGVTSAIDVELARISNVPTLTAGANVLVTLVGADVANAWMIDGADDGTIDGVTFTDFANLTGGTDVDTFTFTDAGSISGTLDGGTGNDIADYSQLTGPQTITVGTLPGAGSVLSIEVLQGGGTDFTLAGTDVATAWTIDDENDGTVGAVSFTDFANLQGGAAIDAFTFTGAGNLTGNLDGGAGADTADYSAVTSAIDADLIRIASVNILNAGTAGTANPLVTLVGDNGPNVWAIDDVDDGTVDGVTFTDFANLRGGTNTDMFVFTLDGNVTGTIDGGGGGGANDADYSGVTSAIDVELARISNVPTLTAGANALVTLVGADVANAWMIDGADDGTIDGVTFTGFANLTGGTDVDTFTFTDAGSISGTLDGGTGNDIADYSQLTGAQTITVGTVPGAGTAISIEVLQGGGADFTLAGTDVATAWTIDDENDGTVGAVSFTDFANLQGGAAIDTFTFTGAGNLTGDLGGGGGADTADYSGVTSAIDADLIRITSVNILNAGTAGTANPLVTLVGDNGPNVWAIDDVDDGTVDGVTFTDFANLRGGTNTDMFVFTLDGNVTGTIDGGGGGGANDADYSGVTSAIDVELARISNVPTLTAGANALVTLVGADVANAWMIDGADDGTIDGVTFTGFANLTGGTDVDTFTFTDAGSLSGTLDGGTGNDIADYSQLTGPQTITVGTLPGAGSVLSIEVLQGGGADFTLAAPDDALANIWTIDGTDDGNVDIDNDTVADVTFIDFSNLTGSADDDTFAFTGTGNIAGDLDGGGGANDADYSGVTAATDAALARIANVTTLNAGTAGTANPLVTLVGDNGANVWAIDDVNDGTVDGVTFTDFANLSGGTNTDMFVFTLGGNITGNIDGGGGAGANDADYSGVTSAIDVELARLSNLPTLDAGGNALVTLVGADVINAWIIDGADDGTIGGVTFTGFANLTGGTAADTFTFDDAGSLSGTLDGGNGNDTADYSQLTAPQTITIGTLPGAVAVTSIEIVQGGGTDFTLAAPATAVANGWTIDGIDDGEIDIGQNATIDLTFIDFSNLTGGTGIDSFAFTGSGNLTGDLDGSGGVNLAVYSGVSSAIDVELARIFNVPTLDAGGNALVTLVGADVANAWTIDGAGDGTVAGVTFTDFANLTGGTMADTFTFDDAGSLSGTLDGGAGDDTADYSLLTSPQTITIGLLPGASAVASIEVLQGGGTDFTLEAPDTSQANGWTIDGIDDGAIDLGQDATVDVTFIDFSNLSGGGGNDSFAFTGSGDLTGILDGGGGANLAVYSGVTSAIAVELARISNVQTLDAGGNALATLVGIDAANAWTIDGAGDGSIDGVTFTGFANLTGGNQVDTFTFDDAGSLSGTLDGGTGDDIADYSQRTAPETVTVGTLPGVGAVTSIEIVQGGGTGFTLVAPDDALANTWEIDDIDDGAIDVDNDTIVDLTFIDFSSLTGGADDDTFIFSATGDLTGDLDGGGGANAADYAGVTAAMAADLSRITNVTTLNAGTAGVANTLVTLMGDDVANAWSIDDVDDGTVGGVSFTDFANLTGGTAEDTFAFVSGGTIGELTGTLDGGAGTDTLDVAGSESDLTVDLESLNATALGAGNIVNAFTGVEALAGDGATQVLLGTTAGSTFTVTDANDGTVDAFAFTDFANLTGGSGADAFLFVSGATVGSLSGTLDGAAGTDTLDVSGSETDLTIDLDALDVSALSAGTIVAAFAGMEDLIGDNLDQTLVGVAAGSAFDVTGENDGTVDVFTFTDFANLTGGAGDDSFAFAAGGSLTGAVDGGAQTSEDSLDLSAAGGGLTVDLQQGTVGVAAGGFTDLESFAGAGTDTLVGQDVASTFTVTAEGDGEIDVTGDMLADFTFTDFASLSGGSADDAFLFVSGADVGSLSGTLDGGAGTDVLDVSGSETDITVDLESLAVAAAVAGTIVGSFTGVDALVGDGALQILAGTDTGSSFTVDSMNGGTADTFVFTDFANLSGGSADDVFAFDAAGSLTGTLSGGAESSADRLDLSAAGAGLVVDLETMTVAVVGGGFDGLEAFTGDNTTHTLQGLTAGGDFLVTGENDGSVAGIAFEDFANLTGGDGNDSFALSGGSVTGTIDGGLGANTLTGDDTVNTFMLDGTDSGSLASSGGSDVAAFTGIGTLAGGSDDDTFAFGAGASLSGTLSGGAQASADTLDVASAGGNLTVNLDGNTVAVIDGGFDGLEAYVGDNATDVLEGPDVASTWTIDGENAGDVNGSTFTGFANLQGGSDDDTFALQAGGAVTGTLDGGAETTADVLDTANAPDVLTVNLETSSTDVVSAFSAIESLVGDDAAQTLVGPDAGGTWIIDGMNSGTIAGFSFSGFANLTGGAGIDTFDIGDDADFGVSGLVEGGAGDDLFLVNYTGAAARTLTIDGGAGADTLTITGGAADFTSEIQIGSIDVTSSAGDGTAQTVASDNVETVEDFLLALALTVNGSGGIDDFDLSSGTSGAMIDVAGTGAIDVDNKTDITIDGGAGNDTMTVSGDFGVAGDLVLAAETVSDGGGSLSASSLTFAGGNIGSAAQAVATSVDMLTLQDVLSAFISEAGGLEFLASTVSGDLDITAQGDLTQAAGAGLVVGGTATLTSALQSVILADKANDFSVLVVDAEGNAEVADRNNVTVRGATTGGGFQIDSWGAVTQTGNVTARGDVEILAANGITMQSGTETRSNGGGILYGTEAGDVTLALLNSGAGKTDVRTLSGAIRSASGTGTNINTSANTVDLFATTRIGASFNDPIAIVAPAQGQIHVPLSNNVFIDVSATPILLSQFDANGAFVQILGGTIANVGQQAAAIATQLGSTTLQELLDVDWALFDPNIRIFQEVPPGVQLPCDQIEQEGAPCAQ